MADDVNKWLDDHGLAKYGEIFASNEIDLSILSRLTEEDLKELGLPLGARRKLQAAIEKLPEFGPPSTPSSATSCASSSISESTPSTNYPASSEPSLVSWERQPEARKPATVLFADITGSTALTEHLDAEDAHDLLDGARQRMCAAIKSNRGTVCRVMGDGVMAVFGAPVASENHAVEACEAALQMQQAIRDYTHELRGQHGSGLKIRIGLHSGEIVVLVGGEGDQVEYDADGPTVPVAARMEQIAQPGNIYLTAATHSLAENRIEADALEAVSVKGISAPIKVFTLRQVKSPEEAAVDVRNTPFVGRRAEINQFGGMVETCLRGGRRADGLRARRTLDWKNTACRGILKERTTAWTICASCFSAPIWRGQRSGCDSLYHKKSACCGAKQRSSGTAAGGAGSTG